MDGLRIVSLNCFGIPVSFNRKMRFENIAKASLEINPDLICFQEVWFKSDREILNGILSPTYKIYPEKYSGFGPGGLLVFSKNLDLLNFEFHKFKNHGPLSFVSSPDIVGGKGFQSFQINNGVKQIQLINTHLLYPYGQTEKMYVSVINQLKQIVDFLKDNNLPLIFIGDLNLITTNTNLISFKNRLGIDEVLSADKITIDPKNLNRGKIMNIYHLGPYRPDYIMTNNLLKIVEEKVIFKEILVSNSKKFQLSDHFGIFAKISW